MRRFSLAFAVAMLVAGTASAQLCPNDQFVWPTNCVPAYVGPGGEAIPEQCATIGPDVYGDLASLPAVYDPTTGYRAPAAVVAAAARQDDLLSIVAGGWGRHRRAANPRNEADVARGIDYQQLNDMAWLVATAPRNNGPHVRWSPFKATDVLTFTNALCGADTHCGAAVNFLQPIETASASWGSKAGYSMTAATLQGLFEIYRRQPVPSRPLLCGVAQ